MTAVPLVNTRKNPAGTCCRMEHKFGGKQEIEKIGGKPVSNTRIVDHWENGGKTVGNGFSLEPDYDLILSRQNPHLGVQYTCTV